MHILHYVGIKQRLASFARHIRTFPGSLIEQSSHQITAKIFLEQLPWYMVANPNCEMYLLAPTSLASGETVTEKLSLAADTSKVLQVTRLPKLSLPRPAYLANILEFVSRCCQ